MIINNNLYTKPQLQRNNKLSSNNANKQNQPAFKGGLKLPEISQHTLESWDFNKYNMPLKIMMLFTFGLVFGARLIQARDANERREVVTRDFSSITTIIFAVPILQKIAAILARKATGVPIAHGTPNFINCLNPNGAFQLASSNDLKHWYTNITGNKFVDTDKKEYKGLLAFCKQMVDKDKKANLWKMFQFLDENSKNALNKIAKSTKTSVDSKPAHKMFMTLTSFMRDKTQLNIPQSNDQIIEMLKKADKTLIDKIEDGLKDQNNLQNVAKFLKSIPDVMNIAIVAGFLGYFLPALNIATTKKLYKKNHSSEQGNSIANKKVDTKKKTDKVNSSSTNTPVPPDSSYMNIRKDLFAKFQK